MDIASTLAMIAGGISALSVFAAVVVWFTKLAGKVEDIKDWINKNDDLGVRLAVVEDRVKFRDEKTLQRNSPISLTDEGAVLLKESGVESYIEKNKESLLKQFENETEPYKIEEKAGRLMTVGIYKDEDIRKFAFSRGATIGEIADVGCVALRDIVLKHKGIDIEKHKN